MGKTMLPEVELRLMSELLSVPQFFTTEKLEQWANDTSGCNMSHDRSELLGYVRKINMHPKTTMIRNSKKDYLIPDASWVGIPGIEEEIPRDFITDAILIAEIMTYSRIVPHGLREDQLLRTYQHHCVEWLVTIGKKRGIEQDITVEILSQYIKRICWRF